MKRIGLKLGTLGTTLAALLSAAIVGCSEPNNTMEVLPPGAQRKPNLEGLPEASVVGEQGASTGSGAAPSTEPPDVAAAASKPEEPLPAKPVGEEVTTKSGLKYQIFKEGQGEVAVPGMKAYVHYTGKFPDGQIFDTSRTRGKALSFTIGNDTIIQGWHEGVAGMKTGERRVLTVPPSLGYGSEGQPPTIPPNATLIFDIELLGVANAAGAAAPVPAPAPANSDPKTNADAKPASAPAPSPSAADPAKP